MRVEDFLLNHKDDIHEALHCDGESLSYSKLYEEARLVSEIIQLKSGSKNVLILLENSLEYVVSFFAVLFSRRTVVPIRYTSKPSEIQNVVDFCEVDLILTDSKKAEAVLCTGGKVKSSLSVFMVDEKRFLVSADTLPLHKR